MRSLIIRPTNFSPAVTRCTAFDRLLGFAKPSLAYSFAERLDPQRLQSSLAQALSKCPEFCGLLVGRGGSYYIEHGLGGALFEVAEARERSVDFVRAATNGGAAGDRIYPSLSSGLPWSKSPLLGVRVTQTPDGCVIGLTYAHIVGDLHALLLLLNAWTRAYRGEDSEPALHIRDRIAYIDEHMPDLDAQPSQFVAPWQEWPRHAARFVFRGAKPVLLEFTWEELAKIHAAAAADSHVTTHDALCAHVFSQVHRLHRPTMRAVLMLSFNYRNRLHMALNTIGNFFDGLKTPVSASADLPAVAVAMRREVNGFPRRWTYAQELERLHAQNPRALRRLRCVDGDMNPLEVGTVLTMSTHRRAGLYDIAFNETKPTLYCCRPATSMNWMTLAMETPDDRGLIVSAYLPQDISEKLVREHQRLRRAGYAELEARHPRRDPSSHTEAFSRS